MEKDFGFSTTVFEKLAHLAESSEEELTTFCREEIKNQLHSANINDLLSMLRSSLLAPDFKNQVMRTLKSRIDDSNFMRLAKFAHQQNLEDLFQETVIYAR